jgi:hypothetical protein
VLASVLLPSRSVPLAGWVGAVTVAVAAEVAEPEPPAFVAVRTTSIVSPTSDAWSKYAELVAPLMFEQLVDEVQFRH